MAKIKTQMKKGTKMRYVIDMLLAVALMIFMLIVWFFLMLTSATASAETWRATWELAEPDLIYQIDVDGVPAGESNAAPLAFEAEPGNNVCIRSRRETGQATAYSAPVCVALPGVIINLVFTR